MVKNCVVTGLLWTVESVVYKPFYPLTACLLKRWNTQWTLQSQCKSLWWIICSHLRGQALQQVIRCLNLSLSFPILHCCVTVNKELLVAIMSNGCEKCSWLDYNKWHKCHSTYHQLSNLTCLQALFIPNVLIRPHIAEKYSLSYPSWQKRGRSCSQDADRENVLKYTSDKSVI